MQLPLDPAVVDLDRLAAWMDERGLGAGPLTDLELIAGGTQNVLLRFRRDGGEYVLRRPPPHKRANSDETMRREARVLAALAGTAVPHPALIAAEPSVDVLGASFYLMAPVEGFNVTLGLPEPHRSDPALQRAMGLGLADTLATLAAVDIDERGLGDLGRTDEWVERQVPRWRRQLDSYREIDAYPGPAIPGVDEVAAWLEAHQPAGFEPGLIHGDFHFANVLIERGGPAVAAIVDWELTTVADPLLDLAHLLSMWGSSELTLPTADEMIDRYAGQVDRDLTDFRWYRVLACYRLGIILEGSHARAFAGLTPVDIGDRLHAHTLDLFAHARDLIDH